MDEKIPREEEWQAPPLPEEIKQIEDPPQMSEAATLGNIFFEPVRTFEDLRRKPRFIFAALLITVLTTAFVFMLSNKIGEEGYRRFINEQLDKNQQTQTLSGEKRKQAVDLQLTIMSVTRYLIPVFLIIGFALGGLIYWLAIKAVGGRANYLHGLSTWVYASFPPTVISMIANMIILIFKPAEEIDVATSQRGLLNANPSFLMDGKEMPVVATFLSTFDLFAIWGWILAAIGLQVVGKISSAAAWGIVIILTLVGLTFRIVFSLLNGMPM